MTGYVSMQYPTVLKTLFLKRKTCCRNKSSQKRINENTFRLNHSLEVSFTRYVNNTLRKKKIKKIKTQYERQIKCETNYLKVSFCRICTGRSTHLKFDHTNQENKKECSHQSLYNTVYRSKSMAARDVFEFKNRNSIKKYLHKI